MKMLSLNNWVYGDNGEFHAFPFHASMQACKWRSKNKYTGEACYSMFPYLDPETDITRILIFKHDIGGFELSDSVIICKKERHVAL